MEPTFSEVRPLWSYALKGQPMAVPVGLSGVCLMASQDSATSPRGGVLRALDVARGRLRWERPFEEMVVNDLAQVSERQLLLTLLGVGRRAERALIGLDAGGGVVWQKDLAVRRVSTAALGPSYAAITVDGERLMLFDPMTGTEQMDVTLPVEASGWAPACDAETVYLPCQAPTLLALDLDGELRWRFDLDGMLSSVWLDQTPLLIDNRVVAVLSSGMVLALDAESGELVWETQVGPRGKRLTRPIADGRRVIVGARDGIYALDIQNGAKVWIFRTGAYVTAPPVVKNDLLFIAGRDRCLYALDRRTGDLSWRYGMAQDVRTPPLLLEDDAAGPYAIVVDRTGAVTCLTYEVAAEMHEAAGRWGKAALAWENQGNPWKAAGAWARHAQRLVHDKVCGAEAAEAWATAARHYAAMGAGSKATKCRRQYARCLELPLITVDIQHPGLVQNAWSRLRFAIRNEGYGVARDLVIRATGEQFVGQIGETHQVPALPPGERLEQQLDIKPQDQGESVPLRIEICYRDDHGQDHRREETLHLPVAAAQAVRNPGRVHISPNMQMLAGETIPTSPEAVELEIRVGRGREGYYDVELTLNGQQVFVGGRLPRTVLDEPVGEDLVAYGQRLHDALFADPAVRDGWHVGRGQAETQGVDRRIRLRIDDDSVELHHVPWELMAERGVILGASENTPFSRYLPIPQPWGRQTAARPLRVLAAIVNPRDIAERYQLAPLNVKMERYILASAFAQMDTDQIQLDFLKPPVTLERLSRALLDGYHWLHFVGHGHYNLRQQRLDLLMEDDLGGTRAIGQHLFTQMLAHRGAQPQLVFLSVCQSALSVNNNHVLTGIGPELVRIGVPAVVAMRNRVHIRTAQKVTGVFYRALLEHGQVDRAMNQARSALLAAGFPDVASPVLFMRLLSGRLLNVT